MPDEEKPGFDTAIDKDERPPKRGFRAWIIRLRGERHFWGASLHREGGAVVRWHGPFPDYLAARNDLEQAQASRRWPHDYNKY